MSTIEQNMEAKKWNKLIPLLWIKMRKKIVCVLSIIYALLILFVFFNNLKYSRYLKNIYGNHDILLYGVKNPEFLYNDVKFFDEINIINIVDSLTVGNKPIWIGNSANVDLACIKILEGRLPEKEQEVALTKSIIEYYDLNLSLNNKIKFSDGKEYNIVGIIDNYLRSQTLYSFDKSINKRNIPDILINENRTNSLNNIILIKFKNNVNIEEFVYNSNIKNYEFNNFTIDSNKNIIYNLDIISYLNRILCLVLIIMLLYCGKEKKYAVIVACMISLLYFHNETKIVISNKAWYSLHNNYSITKELELTKGAFQEVINYNDGIDLKEVESLVRKFGLVDIVYTRNIPFNYYTERLPFGQNIHDINDDEHIDIDKRKYKICYKNIYAHNINFIDDIIYQKITKANSIDLDYNKIQNGEVALVLAFGSKNNIELIRDFKGFFIINETAYFLECDLYFIYLEYEHILKDIFISEYNILFHDNYLLNNNLSIPINNIAINNIESLDFDYYIRGMLNNKKNSSLEFYNNMNNRKIIMKHNLIVYLLFIVNILVLFLFLYNILELKQDDLT